MYRTVSTSFQPEEERPWPASLEYRFLVKKIKISRDGKVTINNHQKKKKKGRVPIDPNMTRCAEEGRNFLSTFPTSGTYQVFSAITGTLIQKTTTTTV